MRPEKNKEGVGQVHDGSVHPGSEDPNVSQPSEAGEGVWILRGQGALLHAGGVHGGGVALLADEEKQEVRIKRNRLEAFLDL